MTSVRSAAAFARFFSRRFVTSRRTTIGDSPPAPMPDRVRPFVHCGPFEVTNDLGASEDGRLLAAFDPALRRRIWIRAVPVGAPPVADTRRDLGRTGRLRWLTGCRSAAENWDAFEAPDGQPLLARHERADVWPVVKTWLVDLSTGPSPVSPLLDMAVSPTVLIGVVLAVTATGAVWTIVCPTRGPHDWIAATRVVPR